MRGSGGSLPRYRDGSTRAVNTEPKDVPAPFSLRLTFEERAMLERAAGDSLPALRG